MKCSSIFLELKPIPLGNVRPGDVFKFWGTVANGQYLRIEAIPTAEGDILAIDLADGRSVRASPTDPVTKIGATFVAQVPARELG